MLFFRAHSDLVKAIKGNYTAKYNQNRQLEQFGRIVRNLKECVMSLKLTYRMANRFARDSYKQEDAVIQSALLARYVGGSGCKWICLRLGEVAVLHKFRITYSQLLGVYTMKILEYRVGKNRIKQIVPNTSTGLISVNDVAHSWESTLSLHTGSDNKPGLRTPQLGALFAIKAHWTVSNEPATIVMPTGTGKTETMIATVVSEQLDRTIIVVPNSLLRKQTADKFLNFGILQTIGVVNQNALPPSVTLLESVPRQLSDLQELLSKSNVIVTTMSLLQRFSESYLTALCDICDVLIIDEAHHISAETWSRVKWELQSLKCLQFTATPFRNDAKKVDGKIIYNFPLSLAQEQGYFEKINFVRIWEFDEEKGDFAIAAAAVEQLESDLASGYAHIILVRAKSKSSADRLYGTIYEPNYGKHNPVLVHSGISKVAQKKALHALENGDSRIVVCVDMA